jgi:hypothetical protein
MISLQTSMKDDLSMGSINLILVSNAGPILLMNLPNNDWAFSMKPDYFLQFVIMVLP